MMALTVKDIVGFERLGKLEQKVMQVACEHAYETEEGLIVDALDSKVRSQYGVGASCTYPIKQLIRKGYLQELGSVELPGFRRPVLRYQVKLQPCLQTVLVERASTGVGTWVLDIVMHGRVIAAIPVNSAFRLTIEGDGPSLSITARQRKR